MDSLAGPRKADACLRIQEGRHIGNELVRELHSQNFVHYVFITTRDACSHQCLLGAQEQHKVAQRPPTGRGPKEERIATSSANMVILIFCTFTSRFLGIAAHADL